MKKKSVYDSGGNTMSFLKKNLLKMKLTFLCLFLSFVQLMAVNSFSQSKNLTLNFKDAKVEDVLMKIEEQSSLYFIYNRDVVDVNRKVSITCSDLKLSEILADLFKETGVVYEIRDRHIILKSSSEQINQQKSISGKVTDSTGATLPGVSVVVKGTTTGTITDANGSYSLPNIPANATLQFSFVGMKTQEISVGSQATINVTMIEESVGIDEVVAIGYGTQKREQLTTAISNVKSDNFIKGSVTDAAQLIRGKVAGLIITTSDGNPTSNAQINLRGITTLKSGTSPLIIIDGVPGSISEVAPEDIESMDVLKDGSAAAIYGTRGTNGVILITTKKVNGETPASIEINSYVSTQQITKRLSFLDASQYRELVAQKKPGAVDNGYNTNWLDEVLQTPLSQVYNISLKSGSKNTSYVANLNYRDMNGIMKKSNNNMISPRLEVSHSMFDGILKLNANISGYQQEYYQGSDPSNADPYDNFVYMSALSYNPTERVKDDNGNWVEHKSLNLVSNPVSFLEETHGLAQISNFKTSGNIVFAPIQGLTIKLLGSRDINNGLRGYYQTSKQYWSLIYNRTGYAARQTSRTLEELTELTANYTKEFKNHQFNGLVGYSWRQNNYQDFYMNNYNFPTDDFNYNRMNLGLALTEGKAYESSYQRESKLIGYFARVNYSFMNKYLFMASVRRESSSKFGANNKTGYFPAVSAGWNITKEAFMQNFAFISNLKLRGGYGITGTEPNDPYMSLRRLDFSGRALVDGKWIQTIGPVSNANPDLKWETKEEMNFGLEYGFLKNRISGAIDVYKRTTRDLLWDYPVPVPPYVFPTMTANAATMENKGIEIQINANPIKTNNFEWNTSVSFSTNQNKLVSLNSGDFNIASGYFDTGHSGEPIQQNLIRNQIGQPIGNFWLYKTIDIDEAGHWIIEGKDGKPKAFVDKTPDDKKICGNGIPKNYLSWVNTFTYKNFDLNISMRGAFGFQIFNLPRAQFGVPTMLSRFNLLSSAYDKIYGKRSLADDQSADAVSYYVENGDFWKIDNITLGYNLSLKGKYVKRIRLYVSGSNLMTFTKYTGIDPEITTSYNGNPMSPGIDGLYRYPASSTYTVGAFINF